MIRRFLFLSAFVIFSSGCTWDQIGSSKRPLRISLPAGASPESLKEAADYFSKSLSEKINQTDFGFKVEFREDQNLKILSEDFKNKQLEIAFVPVMAYLSLKEQNADLIEPFLIDLGPNGERSEKFEILARRNSGIKSLRDFAGKTLALRGPHELSAILPLKLFHDLGIPIVNTLFVNSEDSVVKLIFDRKVDGGAITFVPSKMIRRGKRTELQILDARADLLKLKPSAAREFQVVGFTQDVPNAAWVIRRQIWSSEETSHQMEDRMAEVFLDFSQTEAGKNFLKETAGTSSLMRANESDYAEAERMLSNSKFFQEALHRK